MLPLLRLTGDTVWFVGTGGQGTVGNPQRGFGAGASCEREYETQQKQRIVVVHFDFSVVMFRGEIYVPGAAIQSRLILARIASYQAQRHSLCPR
jgi:hypothetical protein